MVVDKFGRGSSSSRTPLRGLPGAGFKLTKEGDFDISNKLLRNVATALSESDAVNKKLLDDRIRHIYSTIQTMLKNSIPPLEASRERTETLLQQLNEADTKLATEIALLRSVVNSLTSDVQLLLHKAELITDTRRFRNTTQESDGAV